MQLQMGLCLFGGQARHDTPSCFGVRSKEEWGKKKIRVFAVPILYIFFCGNKYAIQNLSSFAFFINLYLSITN